MLSDAAWGAVAAVITPLVALVTWWAKARRKDRVAEKLADLKKIDELQKQIFEMQQERIQHEIERRKSTDMSTQLMLEITTLLKGKGVPR